MRQTMTNEYLFLTDENKDKVEKLKTEGANSKISSTENASFWVAKYTFGNNDESSAKKMSKVHTEIMQYDPLVLSCESSEYYNKILFPLVNEFERKLRKLLYLAVSISNSKNAKDNIKKLEDKTLGVIFEFLFTDQGFIKSIKTRVNASKNSEFEGKENFSKVEILSYLESLTEHTLWDEILEKDVPTLRSRFIDVKTCRNHVMHAHNIDTKTFDEARKLYKSINEELDIAINNIIGNNDNESQNKTVINKAISEALVAMDFSNIREATSLANILSTIDFETIRQIDEMIRPYKKLDSLIKRFDGLELDN